MARSSWQGRNEKGSWIRHFDLAAIDYFFAEYANAKIGLMPESRHSSFLDLNLTHHEGQLAYSIMLRQAHALDFVVSSLIDPPTVGCHVRSLVSDLEAVLLLSIEPAGAPSSIYIMRAHKTSVVHYLAHGIFRQVHEQVDDGDGVMARLLAAPVMSRLIDDDPQLLSDLAELDVSSVLVQ